MSTDLPFFPDNQEIGVRVVRSFSRKRPYPARRTSGTWRPLGSIVSGGSGATGSAGPRIHAADPTKPVLSPSRPHPQRPGSWGDRAQRPAPIGPSPRCSRYTSARCRARFAIPVIVQAVPREPGSRPSFHTLAPPQLSIIDPTRHRPPRRTSRTLHHYEIPDLSPSRIAARSHRPRKSARTMRGQTSRDPDPPPRRVPQESFRESSPARSPSFDRRRGRLIRSGESGGLLWVPCGPRFDSRLRSRTRDRTRRPAFPQNAPLRVLQESLSI